MNIEFKYYDSEVRIDADIKKQDASFSHAFGIHPQTELICTINSVTLFIGEKIELNILPILSPQQIRELELKTLEYYERIL